MRVKSFKVAAITVALMLSLGGGFTFSSAATAQATSAQAQAFATVAFDAVKKATGDGTRPGAQAMLIDVRTGDKYQAGTIPSSRNVPFAEKPDLSVLDNWNKAKEVIVFDEDAKGHAVEMANYLKAQGYSNIKVYSAGVKDWQAKSYLEVETPVVQAAFTKNAVLLIDSRPYPKFLGGSIPGALAIPDNDAEKLAGRFPASKDTYIITFCQGFDCAKSHAVADILWAKGYRNVQVYAAGYPAWKAAGLQTTEGKPAGSAPSASSAPAKLVNGVMLGVDEGSVDGEWFKAQYLVNKLPADVILIDVRKEGVYNNGHLNGAINKPVAELTSADLPKDKVVVFVCMTGSSALEAYMKMKNEGKADMSRVYYFDANIKCDDKSVCDIVPNEPLG